MKNNNDYLKHFVRDKFYVTVKWKVHLGTIHHKYKGLNGCVNFESFLQGPVYLQYFRLNNVKNEKINQLVNWFIRTHSMCIISHSELWKMKKTYNEQVHKIKSSGSINMESMLLSRELYDSKFKQRQLFRISQCPNLSFCDENSPTNRKRLNARCEIK